MRIGVDHDEECPCDNGITHGHRPWACEATRVYLQHAGCLSFEMSIMVTLARYRLGLFQNKYSLNRLRLSTKPNNINSQQNALCRRGRRHFVMAIDTASDPYDEGFCEYRKCGFGFALDCNMQAISGLILSEKRCTLESCEYLRY